ncbi:MAG TPA: methyltransferase domain-containing protein [Kineosporiaceae bacterium]|nr:methyltransferase domain-containing protein [Kineosporiaceae bacterium]
MSATDALPPLEVYGRALAAAAVGVRACLHLVGADGVRTPQEVHRWDAPADAVDERLLDRCDGPTIDLGCGPGRLTEALARRGVPALGVDLSPVALAVAARRGALALHRDLFRPLPGEGRWGTALLADGNIGIGGNPGRLLRRVARLVAPAGRAVVEVHPGDADSRGLVRIAVDGGVESAPFPWAVVGAAALERCAAPAGWSTVETWHDAGRAFVLLTRP